MEQKIGILLVLVVAIASIGAEGKEIVCFECESTENDFSCTAEQSDETKTCRSNVGCFTLKKGNGIVQRGCYDNISKCLEDPENCDICIKDNCNKKPVTYNASCYICEDCSDVDPKQVKQCQKPILYGKKERCYTNTTTSGDKTTYTRGCYNDLTEDQQKDCGKCTKCDTDHCNKEKEATTTSTTSTTTENPKTTEPVTDKPTEAPKPTDPPGLKDFKCIICRSDRSGEAGCAAKEIKNGTFSRTCEATPKDDSEKACYTQILENKIVFRDCISTAKTLNLNISADFCNIDKNPRTKCSYCEGENCNTGPTRSSGAHVNIYGTLISLVAIVVTKLI